MADHKPTIYIVEDEFLVAFEMSDTLEDLGFEVVGPSVHLEDAELIAKTADIDAALLDVNLGGGKTSKPVVEILRRRGIPFVFVTAYDESQITFRLPNDKVLRKPVTSREMLGALRKALPHLETPN